MPAKLNINKQLKLNVPNSHNYTKQQKFFIPCISLPNSIYYRPNY